MHTSFTMDEDLRLSDTEHSLAPYLNFLGAFGSTVSGSELELLLSHSLHCLDNNNNIKNNTI